MFANIIAVIGVVGIIGSLLFSGMQSREVARQTRIQNAIAGAAGKQATDDALRAVLENFVERPDLRAYFYDGKQPPTDGPDRIRVQTIAEMLTDVVESALLGTSLVESTASHQPWSSYAEFLLRESPAIAHTVCVHGDWFPLLAHLRHRLTSDEVR
jgi:predicted cobalt transporter CbtA